MSDQWPVMQSVFNSIDFKRKFAGIFFVLVVGLVLYSIIDESKMALPYSFVITLMGFIPIGMAALLPLGKRINHLPFFVKISLYLSFGYVFSILWSFFFSPISINPFVWFILLGISIFLITVDKIRNKNFSIRSILKTNGYLSLKTIRDTNSTHNLILFGTVGILAVFIIYRSLTFDWPNYGDAEYHSFNIVTQIFEGKLAPNLPLTSTPLQYKLGIHMFIANLTLMYNIQPPQTLVLVGAVSIFLISMLIISIVYYLTRSAWLSVIAFLSSLFVHSAGTGLSYLWGHLNAGTFPNLVGFLYLFLLVLVVLVIKKINLKTLPLLVLLVASGVLIYPTTILYSILILTILAFFTFYSRGFHDKNHNDFLSKSQIWVYSYLHYFVIIFVGIVEGSIIEHIKNVIKFNLTAFMTEFSYRFGFVTQFYLDYRFYISLIGGIIVSSFLIIYFKRFRLIGLIASGFIFLTLIGPHSGIFESWISAGRYSVLIPIFSWIVFSISIDAVFSKNEYGLQKYFSLGSINIKKKDIIIGGFAGFTIFMLVQGNFVDYQILNSDKDWYAEIKPHLQAINWLSAHASSQELILDYRGLPVGISHPYDWISSVAYIIPINGYYSDLSGISDSDLENINNALRINNIQLLKAFLSEYDIGYIISSPNDIDDSFKEYDFFEKVFQSKNDLIFKVKISQPYSIEQYNKDTIRKASSLEALDPVAAMKLYNNILSIDSLEIEAWKGKIRVAVILKSYEEALEIYDKAIEKFDEARTPQGKLYQYIIVELVDGESALLEKIEKIKNSLMRKAKLEALDPVATMKLYNDILSIDSLEIEAWKGKIRVAVILKSYEEALEIYDKAIEKFDEVRFAEKEEKKLFHDAYIEFVKKKIVLLESIDKLKDALRTNQKLLDENKFDISALETKVRILNELGGPGSDRYNRAVLEDIQQMINTLKNR